MICIPAILNKNLQIYSQMSAKCQEIKKKISFIVLSNIFAFSFSQIMRIRTLQQD